VDRILQVKRFYQFGKVIRVGVHFVAIPRLAGTPMAAPVVGNATKSMRP
jgi:hypothetical protein